MAASLVERIRRQQRLQARVLARHVLLSRSPNGSRLLEQARQALGRAPERPLLAAQFAPAEYAVAPPEAFDPATYPGELLPTLAPPEAFDPATYPGELLPTLEPPDGDLFNPFEVFRMPPPDATHGVPTAPPPPEAPAARSPIGPVGQPGADTRPPLSSPPAAMPRPQPDATGAGPAAESIPRPTGESPQPSQRSGLPNAAEEASPAPPVLEPPPLSLPPVATDAPMPPDAPPRAPQPLIGRRVAYVSTSAAVAPSERTPEPPPAPAEPGPAQALSEVQAPADRPSAAVPGDVPSAPAARSDAAAPPAAAPAPPRSADELFQPTEASISPSEWAARLFGAARAPATPDAAAPDAVAPGIAPAAAPGAPPAAALDAARKGEASPGKAPGTPQHAVGDASPHPDASPDAGGDAAPGAPPAARPAAAAPPRRAALFQPTEASVSPSEWSARLFGPPRPAAAAPGAAPAARPDAVAPGASPAAPPRRRDLPSGAEGISPTPLPEATRRFLRPLVGMDPAEVRIYRGPAVARTLDAIQADAVTDGTQVFVGDAAPEGSVEDIGMLAHELTHVARERDPQFVPPVLRGRPLPAQEEQAAAQVEGRVRRVARALPLHQAAPTLPAAAPAMPGVLPAQAPPEPGAPDTPPTATSQPGSPHRWGGLPAPWEPLPAWMGVQAPASEPAPATSVPGAAAPGGKALSAPVGPRPAAVQRAEQGRTVDEGPPLPQLAPPTVVEEPEQAADVDLDSLARQVYDRLKQRLAVERRRAGR